MFEVALLICLIVVPTYVVLDEIDRVEQLKREERDRD